MRLRRSVLAAGFTFGAIVLLATSAWAWCTPTSSFVDRTSWVSAEPNRAPAGTQIAVNGGNWAQASVRVHLGSATGTLVGSGSISGDWAPFSVPVTIPKGTPAASYALVVIVSNSNGASQMSTGFVVTASSSSTGDTGTVAPSSTETSTDAPAPRAVATTSGPAPASPTAGSTEAPGASPTAASTAAPGASPTASAVASTPAPNAQDSAQASTAQAPARATGVAGGPLATPRRSTAVASTPVPATASAAAVTAVDEVVASGPAVASVRSVGDDLWSGFTSGGDPGTAPSLIEAADQGTSAQTIAPALVVSGLVALLGGFALAEVRRRPALAASSSGR